MKAIVISALIALSMGVLAESVELKPPVFQVPHKWEHLQKDSVEMRDTITHNFGILKGLVMAENPEVGRIIAAAIDEIHLESMAIIDRIDGEIQAETLTTDTFEELFIEINYAYRSKIMALGVEFQQFSEVTREVFMKTETKMFVKLSTLAVNFRVYLLGE